MNLRACPHVFLRPCLAISDTCTTGAGAELCPATLVAALPALSVYISLSFAWVGAFMCIVVCVGMWH